MINWSPSSSMALAETELEYLEGCISRIFYAIFKVVKIANTTPDFLKGILPSLGLAILNKNPWTILGNVVVAVNGQLLYVSANCFFDFPNFRFNCKCLLCYPNSISLFSVQRQTFLV